MKVKEIMTKDPAVCKPDTPLRDVAILMVDRDCGQIPVIESSETQRPIGVVTDRTIIVRAVARGMNPLHLTAADVMTSPALTVTPETPVEDCAEALADRRVRRMPVISADGVCQGIVSQADIAQHAPGKLTAKVVRTVSEPI